MNEKKTSERLIAKYMKTKLIVAKIRCYTL